MKIRRWVKVVLGTMAIIFTLSICIDFIRFPECYMPSWRYQLRNDIYANNKDAIQLYEEYYVKHNRDLFDDGFAIREVYMNEGGM